MPRHCPLGSAPVATLPGDTRQPHREGGKVSPWAAPQFGTANLAVVPVAVPGARSSFERGTCVPKQPPPGTCPQETAEQQYIEWAPGGCQVPVWDVSGEQMVHMAPGKWDNPRARGSQHTCCSLAAPGDPQGFSHHVPHPTGLMTSAPSPSTSQESPGTGWAGSCPGSP